MSGSARFKNIYIYIFLVWSSKVGGAGDGKHTDFLLIIVILFEEANDCN